MTGDEAGVHRDKRKRDHITRDVPCPVSCVRCRETEHPFPMVCVCMCVAV